MKNKTLVFSVVCCMLLTISLSTSTIAQQTVCQGDSVILTLTGYKGTIQWENSLDAVTWTVIPGAISDSAVVYANTTNFYRAVVTEGTCLPFYSDTILIGVNPLPTIVAGSDATICEGGSATLSANGASFYSWFPATGLNNTVISNPIANPIVSTTYIVTGTDGNGCTNTDAVIVTVNSSPNADAGVNQNVCNGETATLTASGGIYYNWNTGETTNIITVSPTSTITYSVTVTDANGCTNTDEVTVAVNTLPTVSAGGNQTICEGATITLTTSGGITYVWNTSETDGSITISPLSTATYTVTATDANGCMGTDETVITVNTTPTAEAGINQTICDGETVTLTATGGGSYSWSSGDNIAQTVINPTSTTTYTVTVNVNGCTDTDDVVVTVKITPTADAGIDQTVCDGETATLTATGGGTYSWSSGDNIAQTVITPVLTTTYTVTTTINGCTDTDEIVVTVSSPPTASAGTDVTICDGKSATLTATGGTAYNWSSGSATAQAIVSPTITTTYTVTVSIGICSDTDEVVVTVNATPTANAGTDITICNGETTTLTATGGGTYNWSSGDNTTQTIVNPTSTTTYTVTVTVNGCTDTNEAIVFVNSLPTADAGVDISICNGESVTLTASGGGTYNWSSGDNTAQTIVNPISTTTYTVTATVNGCTDTDESVITVNPLPTVNAGLDDTICASTTTTLTATSNGDIYEWSNAQTTASITVNPVLTTTYTVTVTTLSNGCSAADELVITTNPLPTGNAGIDQTICRYDTATVTATGGGTYVWSTSETTTSITVAPTATTYYTVTVTLNGCTDSDRMRVYVSTVTASAGSDRTICNGASRTLTATGGTSYVWSTSQTTQSITVTPATTTTYTVTVTNTYTCTGTDEVVITVNPIPTANAGTDVTICNGDTATLTATGGGTYLWNTGAATASITVTPTNITTYTVTVTLSGCTSTDNVVVQPLPVVNIGSDIALCDGQSATLTANGGGTYNWSTGATTASITLTPAVGSVTYTVTVTTSGCTDTDDAVVTVNPIPTADAGADVTITTCGSCTILTAAGGGTYNWNTSATTSSITVSPTTITTYTVTVTLNGCTDTDDVVVTVNTPVCPATVTDIDGNVYNTVQIGCQCWMHENLNVTKNPTGSSITRYCFSYNPAYCDTFGGLYTWTTLMNGSTTPGSQGICPNGWHVPKDCEFESLVNKVVELYGGTANDVGDKLTESGRTPEICYGSTPPCGVSGFDALYGGFGLYIGSLSFISQTLYKWTYFWASEWDGSMANIRTLCNTTGCGRGFTPDNTLPGCAMSVRCVKD